MGRKSFKIKREAKKFKLSQEEIRALIKEAQEGSQEAEEKLIFANERLVLKIAGKYSHREDMAPEDIIQIGMIGLINSIRRFDLSYDVKFSTYAVPIIQGAIRLFLRDDNIIKIPRIVKELAYRILKAEMETETPEDIVEALNLVQEDVPFERAVKRVKRSLDFLYNHNVKSMDETFFAGGGNASEDISYGEIVSGDVNGNWFDHMEVRDAMEALPERESRILELRYLHDKGQSEVAKILGISQVQVSRLERRALATVKEELTKEGKPMSRTGDRKRAAKLLRETDMNLKDINEVTLVPMDKLEVLEKKYRAIEKEVTKPVAPVKPVVKPKPVEEPIKEEKVNEMTKKRNSPQRKTTKEERARVIELLREGTYTIPEIEQMTGVPYSTVWYYANKQRIDVVKTSGGLEIEAGKERQAVNAMIQGGNLGIQAEVPPGMVKRIANAEQKITDASIISTAPLTVGAYVKPLEVGMGIRPMPKEEVKALAEKFNNRDFSKEIKMLEAASNPVKSSFTLNVDLTATGNALPKAEVIGKLEQLIRVVQELPTEQVNFNMKVNN
ncbi:putative RNA polymerase sigma 28 subunit [Bacillus phage BC-T25]|nr:putative RNA polymerase sigma 28 subunit [Bacillus phage BC-T25]